MKRFCERFLRINCINKRNVPKKKIIVLSNNKFSRDTVIVYKKADGGTSSDHEWQRVTTNDIEWQWITVVQRMKTTQYTSKNGRLPFFLWQKQMHYFQGWMAAIRVGK